MRAALRRAVSLPARLRPRDLLILLPALLVGALVAGFGTGGLLAATRPITWLADDSRGEIVRVDERGMSGARLSVGGPGQHLEVHQDGMHLVVVNRSTGEVTSIDLDTLLASGHRRCATNAGLRVLVQDGAWYVADRPAGTLSRVDPASLETTGRVWVSPEPLADATIDGAGAVWALSTSGLATRLAWGEAGAAGANTSTGGRFAGTASQQVAGTGATARLVAHETGVTIVAAATGTFVQVGTATPFVRHADPLTGSVELPERSPSSLVPVTYGEVVLLVGAAATASVPVGTMQCTRPGAAAVFEGVIYVPCHSGRVLRLGSDGGRIAADILTGDTASLPTLVLGRDRIFVTVAGAQAGVQVLRDGRTLSFDAGADSASGPDGRPDPAAQPTSVGRPTTRPTPAATPSQPTRPRPTNPTPTTPPTPPGQTNRNVPTPSHPGSAAITGSTGKPNIGDRAPQIVRPFG